MICCWSPSRRRSTARAATSDASWTASWRTERLSCESRGKPGAPVAQDGVEDGEELAHGGGEGNFAGTPGGDQALIEGTDGRVVFGGGKGGHVENAANAGAAAGNHASAPKGAAIAGKGGEADEGGDASAIETTQFGQIGDEGASRH